MSTSAARVLREDDHEELSREAVLLQWERKIEAAERRPTRFERDATEAESGAVETLRPARAPQPAARRPAPAAVPAALPERRTVTITGQPTPARRRRSVIESQVAQPDRIALWAFLLGLFLVAVAAGTAHA
ncbi:MAG TPA: hypothetical protein VK307_01565 [Thermoleophilaceae bacterium]|nr:hypothetical protein [Thermoleophilaceae bacterium]